MSASLSTALAKPSDLESRVASICEASPLSAVASIKVIAANKDGYTTEQIREILEQAQAREVRAKTQRPAVRQALRSALKKLPAKAAAAEVTTAMPKDPRWDHVRETTHQMTLAGRVFLRCQVKLGMLLSALKKEFGISKGKGISTSPDSGKVLPWADLVKQETNYSRQSCDEFIRYWEATKAKLKKAKNIDLPDAAKKDALVLFQVENPLTLTDAQWELVDQVIGTLTTGETQASLLAHLGIVPKPKAMPKGTKNGKDDDDVPAGQLAFHFFDAVAAPLINARTNPDYKKLLLCLPFESDEENPLSLATLEAEARALIADIEEVKQKAHKATRGRIINV